MYWLSYLPNYFNHISSFGTHTAFTSNTICCAGDTGHRRSYGLRHRTTARSRAARLRNNTSARRTYLVPKVTSDSSCGVHSSPAQMADVPKTGYAATTCPPKEGNYQLDSGVYISNYQYIYVTYVTTALVC